MGEPGNKYIDETVMSTPEPRAFSTHSKARDSKKSSLNPNSICKDDSLGILPLSKSGVNILIEPSFISQAEKLSSLSVNSNLEEARRKAKQALRAASAREDSFDCESVFSQNVHSWMESTVNESDLIKQTKLNSKLDNSKLEHSVNSKLETSGCLRPSIPLTNQMGDLQKDLENLDISLKDIFRKYSTTFHEADSGMFMPADVAAEQLKADEISWRKANDLPGNDADFTQTESCSMGEFFRGKSDECSLIFHKKSPEKGSPVVLMDSQFMDGSDLHNGSDLHYGSQMDSVKDLSIAMSLTQIKKFISDDTSTPTKLIDKMMQESNKEVKNCESMLNDKSRMRVTFAHSMDNISDKENVALNSMENSYSSSLRPGSSMESLTSLPMACNKAELIWGCVKVGRIASKSFVIKNRAGYKTRYQICSSNPNFKISRIEPEPTTNVIVVFHPMEQKELFITFNPSSIGAHSAKLSFHPMIKGEAQRSQGQALGLYGYGGYTKIELKKVSKDPSGNQWVSLGNIDQNHNLRSKFIIKNSGTIAGFACFLLNPKSLYAFTNIKIEPATCVIKPGHCREITVDYQPSKQDFKHIKTSGQAGNDVFDIGSLRMISGAEITRGRIRRLSGKVNDSLKDEVMKSISARFDGEIMPDDMSKFKESVSATRELLDSLNKQNIGLTIEVDLDKTLVPGDGIDETSKFHTLVQLQSILDSTSCDIGISVEPTRIIFMPTKVDDSILITSPINCRYDTHVEPEGVLSVNPQSGFLTAGQVKIIGVNCLKRSSSRDTVARVVFCVGDQTISVECKLIKP